MKRYIGQVSQDGGWVAFCVEAEDMFDAADYVDTIPTEGGRCTSLMLTYDEATMVKEDERNRIVGRSWDKR